VCCALMRNGAKEAVARDSGPISGTHQVHDRTGRATLGRHFMPVAAVGGQPFHIGVVSNN